MTSPAICGQATNPDCVERQDLSETDANLGSDGKSTERNKKNFLQEELTSSMANNRQLIQTVNVMTPDGSERKLKVLDPEGIPEGTELFRVSKRGEVLPKGSKTHEPKHLWTIKTFVTSKNDKQETFTVRERIFFL